MTSLPPSLLGGMTQVGPTGSHITPTASVKGLPDPEQVHQIQTLLDTMKGFPDDLQSLTPEQTEVLGKFIASLETPAGASLFGHPCDQESENEPSDWGSYDWKYWADPRNSWGNLPPVIKHGITGNIMIYGHIKLLNTLKSIRREMRQSESASIARGEKRPAIKQTMTDFLFEQGKERVQTLLHIAKTAGRSTVGNPSVGASSAGRPSIEDKSVDESSTRTPSLEQ